MFLDMLTFSYTDWEAQIQHNLFSIIHPYKSGSYAFRKHLTLILVLRHYIAFKWKEKNSILLQHKAKHLLIRVNRLMLVEKGHF